MNAGFRHRLFAVAAWFVCAFGAGLASAQGSGVPPAGASCVVTAGNRNAPLAVDGSYTVFGIPGNLGAIRARASCSDGSVGQSAVGFTNPLAPATIELGPIVFGQLDPVPIAANLSAPQRFLNTGDTSQLNLLAVAADGSSYDVTPRSAGTVYSISNGLMATVTENGLVRIFPQFAPGSSARVVAGAITAGSVSSTFMYILGPRGTLTGTVVRADGTTTVAGAQVSVLRLQLMEQAGTAVTGTTGQFQMTGVNAGTFLVSAIDPATGDRALATARIETEAQTANVTLRMTGQGVVNVTVVNALDAPVASAAVTFTALGGNRDVRTLNTNAQGVASFGGVAAGTFTVSTRDPTTRLVGTAVATLAVNQTLPITLKLQPIGQVQGVVYDVDGTTLRAGVQVRVLSRERGILTQSVTGTDGAFRFDTLPISDGPYTLDAFVGGRLRARVPGIVISNPNDTVTRNVVLGAVGTVTGRVVDPSGTAFANARVTMQSLVGLQINFDARTDANGRFVLPGVPVGAFELTAVTAGGGSGRAQGSVAGDGAVVELDVVIADNTLVGVVYQRDGVTPVGAGVAVYLAPRALGAFYSYAPLFGTGSNGVLRTFTDAQGRFGFDVAVARAYYLQAEQNLERGRTEIVVVNLNPAQPLEARVVFLAKGTVSGLVRDSAGALQVDVPVRVGTRGAFNAERETRTDTQGRYTLEGVFAGDVSVVARNETTNLAGVGTGRLDSEGQQVSINVTLAATGTVRGRVLRRDGSEVPGPVRIAASRNGTAFATREFPGGAAYQFDLVPVGDIELVAEEIANGDKGVATTRVASAGDIRNVDVRLVGQGTLRVRIVNASAAPVVGARVTVTTTRPFVTSQEIVSDADGDAVFARVFAGDYRIVASKAAPVAGLWGSASGTLLSGQEANVTVTVTAFAVGRVIGTVFRADGVTAVGAGMAVRMLPEPYADAFVTATDAQGRYSFDQVEAGTYNVDALNFYTPNACPNRDRIRGRATGVVVAVQGESVVANIQLIGKGRVSGRVSNAQGTPVPGIQVRLTNPDPVYGFNVTCAGTTTYDRVTDAQGNFVMDDVPPGDFTITAQNVAGTLRAEGSGRVRFDGDAVVADLTLIDNAVSMPHTFHDANGFRFDISGNGAIGNGHNNVFTGVAPDNAAMRLEIVRDGVAVPFTNGNGSIGRLTQNGQQIEVDDVTPSGLTVTRRVFTPRAGYFTRYIEFLRNTTTQPITVSVRVKSHHRQSNSNPRVVDTSDGDQVLSVQSATDPDRWAVVDDQTDADPFTSTSIAATGHLFDGAGGAIRAASAGYDLIAQTGRLRYAWDNLTVAPGQTVALMHFAFNQIERSNARAAALRLAQLPPEAIDDLTTDERLAVRNFAVPEQSSVAPLPNLDAGIVSGRVLSGDGTTVVEGAGVRFKSLHALFGRERFATTLADGAFRFRSTLDGSANNYVIPVFGFELSATYARAGTSTALTPGEFDQGQTEEQQDLIFVSTGNIRGAVKRHNAALVANARVNLCRLDNAVTCNDEQPNPANFTQSGSDGQYLMTASRPRDYFLFAAKDHPQEGGPRPRKIRGRATVTVTAGDTAVVDIVMEATGSLSGIVRNANGTPVVNAEVDLELDGDGPQWVGRVTRSDTAGRYRFFDVPLGAHRVTARDSLSQAAGTAVGVIAVDQETAQDITLLGFGQITANVRYARGLPAAGSRVFHGNGFGVFTDTNGVAIFQLPQGQYTMTAYHPDSDIVVLRGEANAEITQPGQQVNVTITLQPAGSVRGTIVRPDGTTLADGFPYIVRQIRGSGAGTRNGQTTNTGTYRTAGLPIGGYLITAYDAQQDRFAEAEFDISADGEELVVDLTLLANRIALPAQMRDANRFAFDIQRSGALLGGSGAYDNAGVKLSINGQDYVGDSSARLEAGRRQFAITQPSTLGGLTVTRKVYVPRGAYFARYIEVLENPSGTAITASVSLTSHFAAGGVLATSSGDTVVTSADRWVTIDDAVNQDVLLDHSQMPAVSHVFAAPSGVGAPDSVGVTTVDGRPRLTQTWSALSIPAGGQVSLLHFAVQQVNRAGARASVDRLIALPPEVLADLSAAEAATVRNFAMPADLVSTLQPLPSLTGRANGIAFEGDVRTQVRGASITVQSEHPLFNRVWGMRSNPQPGCPPGTPVASLVSASAGGQNPPPLGSYVLRGQLTAEDSIAVPEGVNVRITAQEAMTCFGYSAGHPSTGFPSRVTTVPASATQDVIFDTGILTGSIVGDANFSVIAGRVYRSIDDPDPPDPVFVPIASDATFVYSGLPPGSYDLLFDTPAPNAGDDDGGLRGSRTNVQVTLGQITVTDVSMQPTSRVDGTVTTANGEPARDAQLRLFGVATGQQYDQCATGCVPATLAKHRGKRAVERELVADSLGRFNFVAVPAGEYTLTAIDPVSGGRRTVPVTIASNPVTVPIVLLAVGSANLTVTSPAGNPVVDAFVYLTIQGSSSEEVAGRTDPQGRLTIANIPQGGYTLRVRDPRYTNAAFMDRRVTGTIVSGGQQDAHAVRLLAAATLAVSVIDGDNAGAPVSGATVSITDISGVRPIGVTNAQGRIDITPVPEGDYTVRARARINNIDREANVPGTVAIADDQQTRAVVLDLRSSQVPLPVNVYDANRQLYRIDADAGGPNLPRLQLAGAAFTGAAAATQQLGGRQHSISQQTPLAGLNVTRQVFVHRNGYFARYVEILENPGAAAVTVEVKLSTLAFNSWSVRDTSSGDDVLDSTGPNPDRWFTYTRPNQSSEAAWGVVASGAGATLPAPALAFENVGGFQSAASATWPAVTVPAGQRVALLYFAVQQLNPAGAKAAAERLYQLPPEALEGLETEVIGAIRNFVVPPDGQSAVAPLPALDGSLSGRTLEGDGTTPVAGVRVTVRSQHPLFNREWTSGLVPTLQSDATGAYSIVGALRDDAQSIAIPVDSPLTLGALHPQSQATATATASFAPGNSTSTQDIAFVSGLIQGSVTGAYQYPTIAGGRVTAFQGTTSRGFAPIQTDGSYRLGGLAAGTYRLEATFNVSGGTALPGQVGAVSVTLGQATQQDVALQANGGVSGRVLSGGNAGVANQLIRLTSTGFVRQLLSDAQGRYTFNAVPAGTHTLQVTDPRTGSDVAATVVVTANQATAQDLLLPGLGNVTVTVRFARGALASGVTVYATSPSITGRRGLGTTQAAGTVSTQLAVGPFTIIARHPLTNIEVETTGVVANDGELVNVSVALRASANVRVRVVDAVAGNAPVAGARVRYRPAGTNTWLGFQTTDASGWTVYPNLSEATYDVDALAPDARTAAGSVVVDTSADGQVAEQTLTLTSAMEQLGLIGFNGESHLFGVNASAGDRIAVGINGFPVGQSPGNCEIAARAFAADRALLAHGYGRGPTGNFAQFNYQGNLRNVPATVAGFYAIAISSNTPACFPDGYRLTLAVNDAAVAAQPYQGGGTVRGRLFRPDGTTGVADAKVRLRTSGEPRLHVERTTGADGSFVFDNVPRDSFTLISLPLSGSTVNAQVSGAVQNAGQTVVQDLVLPASTVLNIRALRADGTAYDQQVPFSLTAPPNFSFSTSTNNEGRYTYTYVGNARLLVSMRDPANPALSGEAIVQPADGQTLDVPVRIAATVVQGRVLNDSGAGVSNAFVRALRVANGLQLATMNTNAQGEFRFDALPAGAIVDLETADPLTEVRVSARVTLVGGQTVQQDLQLPGRGSIRGNVRHDWGSAIAGADVVATYVVDDAQGSTTTRTATSDATGAYVLANLPFGRAVTVIASKYASDAPYPYGNQISSAPVTATLSSANSNPQVDFTLDMPGGSIIVRVMDGNGAPITGDCLFQLTVGSETVGERYGPCEVGHTFDGVPVGSAAVSARVNEAPLGDLTITVVASQNVEVVFRPQGTVRGVVRFANLAVVPYPDASLIDAQGMFRSGPTTVDGGYRIDNVPLGSFELRVTDGASGLRATRTGSVTNVSVPVVIDLMLPPSGRISGLVRDAGGDSVPYAALFANSSGLASLDRQIQADELGRFVFERVALGEVAVAALHQGPTQSGNVATASTTLASDGQAVSLDLTFPVPGSLSGVITRPDGSVAPAACVGLWSTAEGLGFNQVYLSTSADSFGRYAFASVVPGPLVVHARSCSEPPTVGLGSAVVTSGAQSTRDAQLGNAVDVAPALIDSVSGYRFFVEGNGAVFPEESITFGNIPFNQASPELKVGSRTFPYRPAARVAQNGRELLFEPTTLSGLRVSRRVHVPAAGGYARVMETFFNPGASPITVNLDLRGAYADTAPVLTVAPGSVGNRYALQVPADPAATAAPGAAAYVFGSNGASVPTRLNFSNGVQDFGWGWTLTVPAGGTASYLHYLVVRTAPNAAAAQAQAGDIANMTQPGMFDGLSASERASVQNFAVPP